MNKTGRNKKISVSESRRKLYAKYGLEYLLKGKRKHEHVNDFPSLHVATSVSATSDSIPGSCYKKSLDDYKWKRNRETKEAIEQAEKKKKMIAIPYNKGAYQYITEETHLPSLGKKT